MNRKALTDLYYQALETELGGIAVYEAALMCVERADLREEWTKYLEQTRHHHDLLLELFKAEGLDPEADTPGRTVVRGLGQALVGSIERAMESAPKEMAQIVAAECIVLAETKDHLNWELLSETAKALKAKGKELKAAVEEVEPDEDEHLYHTAGWLRELWIDALGMPAALPPPEEEKDVKTAIGAARAKQQRKEML